MAICNRRNFRADLNCNRPLMPSPLAIKMSAVDRQAYPVKIDVEHPFGISVAAKGWLANVFDEDMVFLKLKFCCL